MTAKWNPKLHPRDGENGRFTRNWEARLSEQIDAGREEGRFGGYTPVTRGGTHAPPAKARGFVRVGDHPTGRGAVGGEDSMYFGASSHPEAGGVWVDPQRPGTSHAPLFRNDFGHAITDLKPPKSRSQQHKGEVSSRRRDDWTHTPEDRERTPARESVGPRSREVPGVTAFRAAREPGGKLGRRLEGAPEAAVKEMRRAQRRTRAETGRQGVRRTPRGTQVDSWMDTVNSRLEKGTGRG